MTALQQIEIGKMALVVASHEVQYADPLVVDVGDELKIVKRQDDEGPGWVFCESRSGKKGWVPESSLKIEGDRAVAVQSHLAREIPVMEGEIVRIERLENGRAWVTNMTNETGWLSLKNLRIVE